LISGNLIKDPVTRTGPSGKPYTTFLLRVPLGEDEPGIVSGIAFSECGERIAKLVKGDAVAMIGSLKPSEWSDKTTGETRHGMNITAQACLSPYDVKKRRASNGDESQKKAYAPKQYQRDSVPKGRDAGYPKEFESKDFDDDIPF
ncbi:MAG: single-stranded DNA-binding protein, partial [Methylococcales bacterium]